jgi:hypothetical protein
VSAGVGRGAAVENRRRFRGDASIGRSDPRNRRRRFRGDARARPGAADPAAGPAVPGVSAGASGARRCCPRTALFRGDPRPEGRGALPRRRIRRSARRRGRAPVSTRLPRGMPQTLPRRRSRRRGATSVRRERAPGRFHASRRRSVRPGRPGPGRYVDPEGEARDVSAETFPSAVLLEWTSPTLADGPRPGRNPGRGGPRRFSGDAIRAAGEALAAPATVPRPAAVPIRRRFRGDAGSSGATLDRPVPEPAEGG